MTSAPDSLHDATPPSDTPPPSTPDHLRTVWDHDPTPDEVAAAEAALLQSLAILARRPKTAPLTTIDDLTPGRAAALLLKLVEGPEEAPRVLPLALRAALTAQAVRNDSWVGEEEKMPLEARLHQPLQPTEPVEEAVAWATAALTPPADVWAADGDQVLMTLGLFDAQDGPPRHGDSQALGWAGSLASLPQLGGRWAATELVPRWSSRPRPRASDRATADARLAWLRALPLDWRAHLRPWVSLRPEDDVRQRWSGFSEAHDELRERGRAPQLDRYTVSQELSLLGAWLWLAPDQPLTPQDAADVEGRLTHLLDLVLDQPSRTSGTGWIGHQSIRDLHDLVLLISWCRRQPWARPDFVPQLGPELWEETQEILAARRPEQQTTAGPRPSFARIGAEQDVSDADHWLRLLTVLATAGDGAAQAAIVDLRRDVQGARMAPGYLWALARALDPAVRSSVLEQPDPRNPSAPTRLEAGKEVLAQALQIWGQQDPPLSPSTLETLAACRPMEAEIGRVGPAVLTVLVGEPEGGQWGERNLLERLTPEILRDTFDLGGTVSAADVAALVARWEQPPEGARWSRAAKSEWPLERLGHLGPAVSADGPTGWARALRPLLRERLLRGGVQHDALASLVKLAAAATDAEDHTGAGEPLLGAAAEDLAPEAVDAGLQPPRKSPSPRVR